MRPDLIDSLDAFAATAAEKRRSYDTLAAKVERRLGVWDENLLRAVSAAAQSAKTATANGALLRNEVADALYAAAGQGDVAAAELQAAIGPSVVALERGRADNATVEHCARALLASAGPIAAVYGL